MLLLASTVLQRGVGFIREICFCRWLSPEQLGQWDMAFGFMMMAGPLLVMSLPGTFGRYMERYRQAGQFRSFLIRTARFCTMLAVPLLLVILVFRGAVSYLVFGSRDHEGMVLLMAAGLVSIVGFNYMVCVFTSLRNMKVVSLIELGNSVFFGMLGIALLCRGQATAGAMVVAYGMSCLLCVAGSAAWLARTWRSFPQESVRPPQRELWSRLLPLAAWIMLINFLWNLFDVVDRYMIVHLLPGTPADALAEVGNYRSSRVLPLLLSSITIMVAGALLPHLSHDWEAGRRRQVSQRLNLFLKIWSVLLTAGAAAVLFVAPVLFRVGFQSKFAGGLHVLPWTLTYCTWFGLSMLLQTYLWCAETGLCGKPRGLVGRAGQRGIEPGAAATDGPAGRGPGHCRGQLCGTVFDARALPPLRAGRPAGDDHRLADADQHTRRAVGRLGSPGRGRFPNDCRGRIPFARREAGVSRRGGTLLWQVPLSDRAARKRRDEPMPQFTFLTSLAELRAARAGLGRPLAAERLHVAVGPRRNGRPLAGALRAAESAFVRSSWKKMAAGWLPCRWSSAEQAAYSARARCRATHGPPAPRYYGT